jgi:hypothetical protein
MVQGSECHAGNTATRQTKIGRKNVSVSLGFTKIAYTANCNVGYSESN